VGSNTATTVPFNLRSITFDSTANAGAGGFWVSNYNSGFYHISRTGTVLDSIGAAAHGISNVYGIAFDPYTSGGPYLWAHLLGAGGNEATLKRVQIPTGASTVSHDVNIDFGPGITAGSVSITWRYRPGTWTIMGVGQGAPDVFFGYELADYIPPSLDASADSLVFDPPYTIIPTFEVVPYSWQVKATNGGTTTITDLTTTFKLTDGVTDYYAPAATHDANVAPFSSVYNNFGPFIPATGLYFEQALVSTGSQTDVNANNDTAMVPLLSVEDSVYAREAGTSTGSLGIGDGIGGTLGQYFTLSQPADITTATFLLNAPTAGDFTSVDLYSFSGTPQTILASSADYTFTTADTDGVVLHLPFIGGPISVPAGDYFLGVNEHAFNVTLARTAFNYRPNSTFVTFTGAPWAPSESFGFPVTYLLRLNVHPSTVNVNEVEESSKISVYPNPSNGKIFIRNNASANEYVINVFNSVGQVVYQQSYSNQMNAVVDLSKQANGVYSIQVKSSDEVVTQSVIITHD
jgi:hypothetical protein